MRATDVLGRLGVDRQSPWRPPPVPFDRSPIGIPLVDRYLRVLADGLDPPIVAGERRDLLPFCRWAAAGRTAEGAAAVVRHLTRAGLRAYVEHELRPRDGRRLALPTLYRRLLAVRRFYRWAVGRDGVCRNPVPPERRRPLARPCCWPG